MIKKRVSQSTKDIQTNKDNEGGNIELYVNGERQLSRPDSA